MKKLCCFSLALMMALIPVIVLAAPASRQKEDIPETTVVDIQPENPSEEVIPPVVNIVPDTEAVIELQEEMRTIYRLTVNYVYADGSTAASSYDVMLQEGETYAVSSPSIEGYTVSVGQVSGVMPARNLQYTVVYLSPEEETSAFPYSRMQNFLSLEEYETPLGLGFSMTNVGICIE